MTLTPDDLTTSQPGGSRWPHHERLTRSITPSFTLFLNFPWEPSGSAGLFSMVCPGLLAQHQQHMLPFLHHSVGSVDGPHCAGAGISSGVRKLHTKGYRSLSRTRSTAAPKRLTSYGCNKSRQRATGKSGQHLHPRCWKSQGNKTRYRKGEGVSGNTRSWLCRGLRPTQPPDPTPEVTCKHSRRWPQLQILYMGSHVHSLQGDLLSDPETALHVHSLQGESLPRSWSWGHTSTGIHRDGP